jgi:HAMP domain-containing protein
MKNALWLKVFIFVTIPLMLIYALQSVFVVQNLIHDRSERAKQDVKHAALFNEINLQKYVDTARLALTITIRELQDIDTARPDARDLGEQVLVSGFGNSALVNSWLIFEPNAFDGRDEEHRGEYPGEGRYIRSYVRQGDGYVEAPDMDETLLDNMNAASRYLVPGISREPFVSINDEYGLSRDYGAGEEQFGCISLSAPVFRNGEFIGCVGQDLLLTEEVLGPEMIPGVVSALFTTAGILFCHRDPGKVGKSLEELGFPGAGRIREALDRGESLFLSGARSPLLNTGALACFYPVKLGGFDRFIYVYTTVPESGVRDPLFPLLRLFLCVFVLFLIIFIVFFYYLFRAVSRPLRELNLACEAVSRGKFNTEIVRSRSRDEIGTLIQSFHRMVEQFRMHITMQEQSQKLLDMYTRLYKALYRHGRMEDVFDEMMPVIGNFFAIRRALLVIVAGEAARVFASFEPGKGVQRVEGEQFLYHQQAAALLAGKRYLSLNAEALRQQKVDFAGSHVLFLCLLPFLVSNDLRGYIIMEGDSETGPVVHHDAALLFLSETISFMLSQGEAAAMSAAPVQQNSGSAARAGKPAEAVESESALPGKEELPVIKAARTIKELDVDRGLFHAGGVEEQYGELLRISARSFTAKMQTMRSLYTADLPAFSIEIHGIKGALNAIGAGGLGEQARELEFAAKAGDTRYCTGIYPFFEEKLAVFTTQLEAITKKREIPSRGPGSIPALIDALEEVLEASRMFDSTRAAGRVSSLLGYSWEDGRAKETTESPPRIEETLERISDALDSMDYDEAEQDIVLLLEYLKAGTAPQLETRFHEASFYH